MKNVHTFLIIITLILVVFASYDSNAAQPNEAIADILVVDDTDDAYQFRTGAGYHRHINDDEYFGFHTGTWLVKDPNGRHSANYITMDHKLVLDENTNLFGNITFYDKFLMFDYTATHKRDNWYFEGGASSSFVDSILAIKSDITADTLFVSADYTFNPEWTVSGLLMSTSFSDNNDKMRTGVRVIYSFTDYPGWSVQYRGRLTTSKFDPIEYFAPEKMVQHTVLVGYVTGIFNDQLLLRAYVGPGVQTINNNPQESTLEWDISVRGNIDDRLSTTVRHVCASDGGEYDYRYCSLSASMSYSW